MSLFQIILRNVEWYQYLINAMLVICGRALDILSTAYVTRDLKLETNKLAQKVGWKGMILMQAIVVILGSLDFYIAFFIFMWSLLLFGNNIEGSWYVKEVGEEEYYNEISEQVKKTKPWKIFLAETSHMINFSVAGILILLSVFFFHDYMIIFFVCLALICQGFLGTMRSLMYLLSLRKEEEDKKNEKDEESEKKSEED